MTVFYIFGNPTLREYIIFWAFLLAARRSRRAMGYAIASVLFAPCWRMPSACLTQKKCFLWGIGFTRPPAPKWKG